MLRLILCLLAPLFAGATYEAARAEFVQGRFEAALTMLEALPPEVASEAAAQNLKALALAQLHRYDEAIDAIERARRKDPKNLTYAYNAGLIFYDAGRLEDSARLFAAAVQQFGPSAPLLAGLGEVQFRLNRFADGERNLNEALTLAPHNIAARIVLARLYRATGQSERFDAAAAAAVALDPRNPQACYYYGLAKLEAGDRTAAIEHIRRSVELQPDFAEAWKSWGRLLAEDGKWQDAVRTYEQAAQTDAGDPETLFLLATAYRKLGETEKAAQTLARYRTLKR
jgi:tetratricopeptide (TPR) repeat protein